MCVIIIACITVHSIVVTLYMYRYVLVIMINFYVKSKSWLIYNAWLVDFTGLYNNSCMTLAQVIQ